jgi:hypothetical protein
MAWAMELTPAGFDAMLVDLSFMDRKTGRAYLQLMGYLRRFGSVPTGERALASVLNVTVRFLNEVAWPLLEDRLVRSDDGKRYFSPGVTADGGSRRTTQGPTASPEKSPRHQKASLARWHPKGVDSDASAHASDDASRMQPDAKMHAKSMHDASEMHAKSAPDASPDASDASAPASAPALSLPLTSLPESQENWRDSLGEREDGRMRVDASGHASDDASRMQPDASKHGPTAGPPKLHEVRASARPDRTRLTADWMPTEADEAFAKALGQHPDAIAGAFRDHYLGTGDVKLDWNSAFRSFCRKQPSFGPLAIPGGKPAEATSTAAPTAADKAATAARAKVEHRTVPLITWWFTHKTGARPPMTAQLMAHCDAGRSAAAYRWLAVMETACEADVPCLLLPEFEAYLADPAGMEDRMRNCEEVQTAARARAHG